LPAIIRFATPPKLRADQEEAAAAKRSELRASKILASEISN